MTERKAVVKNADMPEDMQQDAVEVSLLCMSFCVLYCIKIFRLQPRQWRNLTLKKISQLSSRKNLTRNTTQHGIVLLEEISDHMLRTKQRTLFIFILDKLLFCFSNPDSHCSIHHTSKTLVIIIIMFVIL